MTIEYLNSIMNNQESDILADVIFVIEGTSLNGGYFNDLRNNYIIPTMDYFSPGLEEIDYAPEGTNNLYGVVLYQASDCMPLPNCQTYGPFSNPQKMLHTLDKLELIGGKGETCAHIAEGLATALMCFEELQLKRDNMIAQKHCILICNSMPYLVPVTECYNYANKTVDQLAIILQEKGIHLSIISPRKSLTLLKIFEKAGGDLSTLQTKNYAKDPRHLVLLNGYSLKERPISLNENIPQTNINMTPTLLSPLSANDSPKPSGVQSAAPVMNPNAAGQFRPNQNPAMGTNPNMMGNNLNQIRQVNHINGQFPNQPQMCGSPSYLAPNTMQRGPNPRAWMMPPQQRPPYMNNPALGQNSALISQLTTPSHTLQCGTPGAMMQNFQGPATGNINAPVQQPLTQQGAPQNSIRERHTIWHGLLEWIEKAKTPSDQQKHTKHVPCTVSANSKDGEPELKAESWPPKLIMQLMPKQLISNIGGQYLKDSKSVLFHPQACDALESLTKVMSSGFAGCVHFTAMASGMCDIKVLILLYTAEKKAYLGFIPNNQTAFVERLRRVIQQQKQSQVLMRQGQAPPGSQGNMNSAPGVPSPSQLGGPSMNNAGNRPTASSQPNSQSGIMLSQTNTMAMGGGQITQNVVTTSATNVVNGPRIGLMQPGANTMNAQNQSNIRGQNMMGGSSQRPPFDHIEAARQQNLEKILQLKQTLEAAQQAEAQYKSQLEIYSLQQIQESLQTAQHKEAQYKQQIDQEQRKQLQAQLQQMQQRGMNVPQGGSGSITNTMTGQANISSGMPGAGM